MKRFLFFFFLVLPALAFAQSEVRLLESYLRQAGLTASELTLVQTGQLNQIRVQDAGTANALRLNQQGTGNVLDLDLPRTGTEFRFGQWGNFNAVQWRAAAQSGGLVDVMQRGDGNRLVQDGSSLLAGVPLRIEQTGGMQLILKSGHQP
jgi:hypothetical protein